MDASSIYSLTLSQLDSTELVMTSPDGDTLIRNASPTDHQSAVQMLLDVHEARLALGNASLLSITDELKANESAIVAGTKAVQAALTSLTNLAQILTTVGSLIKTVAQIVPMV